MANLDFSDEARKARFFEATELITRGHRILQDDVGADNPADNAFIREATVCALEGLVWVGDRGGIDALDSNGGEVEIKSTRLDGRASISFPTSRSVSPTVIARFRSALWWAFAVFDVYEDLVAVYRVEQAAMKLLIDRLEARMLARRAAGAHDENNPHLSFSEVRSQATVRFLDSKYTESRVGSSWSLRAK